MSDAAPTKGPAVPVWTCQFLPAPDAGAVPLNALTVGAPFLWKCHGDLAVTWDGNQAVNLAFAKPDDKYTLTILKTLRQDPNDVEYLVTAYKAGEHKPEFVRVLQGDKGFETQGATWKVESVLDPKQQPQPYGSFGPWSLSLPIWFSVAVALLLALIGYVIFRFFRRRAQRRHMLEQLKRHATALSPLHQFYRDARQLNRRLHALTTPVDLSPLTADLDRDFRLFLLREFQVPALDWSDAEILRDLRRRHRHVFKATASVLRKTLRELRELKARTGAAAADFEQVHRMTLETAERVDLAREATP